MLNYHICCSYAYVTLQCCIGMKCILLYAVLNLCTLNFQVILNNCCIFNKNHCIFHALKAAQCSILHITVSVILLISVIFPKAFYLFFVLLHLFVLIVFLLFLLINDCILVFVCLMTFIYIIYGSIAFNLLL